MEKRLNTGFKFCLRGRAWPWGFGMAAVYALTCQQGVSWQDSGKMQLRILAGDYSGWEGIPLAHPLYIWMERMWMALLKGCGWNGDVFLGMNLFSALGLGVAVAMVWHVAAAVSGRREAGWAAAVLFGFAHMPWWMGTITEVYTWGMVLHATEWWVLAMIVTRGWGVAGWTWLALVNGAHMSFENMAVLNGPVYAGLWFWQVARGKVKWWSIGVMALAWLGGASLWCWQVLGSMNANGFVAGLKDGLFGYSFEERVMGSSKHFGALWKMNMGIFCLNFLNPLWLFAGWGVAKVARGGVLRRNGVGLVFGALLLIHGIFFVRYPVADQATFSIPTIGLLAVMGGGGVALVTATWRRRWPLALLGMITPVVLYACAGYILGGMYESGKIPSRVRTLPGRDEIRYWALPWKAGERSAELFTQAVRAAFAAREGCVLWVDATAVTTLQAAQHAEGWSTPEIVSGRSFSDRQPDEIVEHYLQLAHEGRFYVVSPFAGYAPADVLERMDFIHDGAVYRAVPKDKTR